jgi:hypothetical protein
MPKPRSRRRRDAPADRRTLFWALTKKTPKRASTYARERSEGILGPSAVTGTTRAQRGARRASAGPRRAQRAAGGLYRGSDGRARDAKRIERRTPSVRWPVIRERDVPSEPWSRVSAATASGQQIRPAAASLRAKAAEATFPSASLGPYLASDVSAVLVLRAGLVSEATAAVRTAGPLRANGRDQSERCLGGPGATPLGRE